MAFTMHLDFDYASKHSNFITFLIIEPHWTSAAALSLQLAYPFYGNGSRAQSSMFILSDKFFAINCSRNYFFFASFYENNQY